MNREALARICHEANRALCAAHGDLSQLAWDEAPGWQRQSSAETVDWLLAHPDASARDAHEMWVRGKADAGWQYGEVKDDRTRTHPNMVDFDELDAFSRAKDALMVGVVRALAPSVPST